MTIKYDATKRYHKKRAIPADAVSYQKFIKGESDTLEIRIGGRKPHTSWPETLKNTSRKFSMNIIRPKYKQNDPSKKIFCNPSKL